MRERAVQRGSREKVQVRERLVGVPSKPGITAVQIVVASPNMFFSLTLNSTWIGLAGERAEEEEK